jgi:hypothetical protein
MLYNLSAMLTGYIFHIVLTITYTLDTLALSIHRPAQTYLRLPTSPKA